VVVKFTSEVAWLELWYHRVFSRHLKLELFGDDPRIFLLSKFLRLGGWFRLPCSRGTLRIFGLLSRTCLNSLCRFGTFSLSWELPFIISEAPGKLSHLRHEHLHHVEHLMVGASDLRHVAIDVLQHLVYGFELGDGVLVDLRLCDRTAQNNSVLSPKPVPVAIKQ
jgi:hypothetical protein